LQQVGCTRLYVMRCISFRSVSLFPSIIINIGLTWITRIGYTSKMWRFLVIEYMTCLKWFVAYFLQRIRIDGTQVWSTVCCRQQCGVCALLFRWFWLACCMSVSIRKSNNELIA
jgi:hypothetical protein